MYGAETYGTDSGYGRGNEFMIGLLCGTAVGAAIGLLLAPKSGAELRSQLADSADKLRRKAGDTYDQASGAVNDMVDKGRDAVKRGREKFDEARSTYTGETNTGQSQTY
jgi:gas vesicle protein